MTMAVIAQFSEIFGQEESPWPRAFVSRGVSRGRRFLARLSPKQKRDCQNQA